MQIDLNADLGEGAPHDEALLDLVTSANVACGLHAGDPTRMRTTIEQAAARGVSVGAHPGWADREELGRREVDMPAEMIRDLVTYQLGAIAPFVQGVRRRLRHVKPHGALYNQAARDEGIATAIAGAVAAFDRGLSLYGPAGSRLELAARATGLRFVSEVFADRTYQDDGTLTPRARPDAFVHDAAEAARRVVDMLRTGEVATVSGRRIPVRAETVCVHGDNPEAVAFASALRAALDGAGVVLRAPGA